MPQYFTYQWKREEFDSCSSSTVINRVYSSKFSQKGVSIGDFVYILTHFDQVVRLLGRIKVEDIDYELESQEIYSGTEDQMNVIFDLVVTNSNLKKFRFTPDDKCPVFKGGVAKYQTLRGVRQITQSTSQLLDLMLEQHLGLNQSDIHVEDSVPFVFEEPTINKFSEGEERLRIHYVRERSREAVSQKKREVFKRTGMLACEVCGFDFSVTYGSLGEEFIECHHTKPMSSMTEGQITKLEDLVIVCSNCHSMIHRKTPMLTVEKLKRVIKKSAQEK